MYYLLWNTKGYITVKIHFTDITDFDRYNFTIDGRVFVKSTGRECPVFRNKDGYLYYNLTCKLGKTKFLRKHRIIAALSHGLPKKSFLFNC
jgi:hypothetical protein